MPNKKKNKTKKLRSNKFFNEGARSLFEIPTVEELHSITREHMMENERLRRIKEGEKLFASENERLRRIKEGEKLFELENERLRRIREEENAMMKGERGGKTIKNKQVAGTNSIPKTPPRKKQKTDKTLSPKNKTIKNSNQGLISPPHVIGPSVSVMRGLESLHGGKKRKTYKKYYKIKRKQREFNKNKTCKNFCRKVFLPEKERVEQKFSKYYEPIEVMRNKDDEFEKETADILEKAYLDSCNDIYCQKKCKNKQKWVKSISKERKKRLEKQGAMSGCRDLIQEFPDYYENI
jgi:hypothetical protein